jgi:hypothetical protein
MFRFILTALIFTGLSFGQTENPLATLRKQHPRLIALDSDIDRIRESIHQDPEARKIYERLVADAQKIETQRPVEYKLIGPRLLDQSRRALSRIYTLALLYRLDHKRQYLDRALTEMRAAANFQDWHPPHFLDTAEMTHAMAIGYDWLYNDLKPEDRAWIRKSIVEKGLNAALPLYEKQKSWTVNTFNWNLVCNGGIGIGALAIAEDDPEESRTILKYALKSFPLAMTQYDPDGGWKEGPGYWHYATRYAAYFISALDSALGTDFGFSSSKGFDQAGRFLIYSCGPEGTFNYADAHPNASGAPEMFWLAKRFSNPVYSWYEQSYLRHADAFDLLWYQPKTAASPKQAAWPLDAVFQSVQVGYLRSSWDTDAIFAAMKAGDNKAGHSHLDLGTFVMDAGGQRWAADLGPDDYNLPVGYFGKHRWEVYRTRTESHNTVLIDGQNQDPNADAKIVAQRSTPNLAFVRIDLSKAYPTLLKHFERGMAMVDRKYIVVQDEIRAKQPVEPLWGMVTEAAVSLQGETAELRIGSQTLQARILSPAGAKFDVVSTQPPPPQNQNEGTRKLVVRLPGKTVDVRLVVALIPLKGAGAGSTVKWKDRPLAQW